jgi:two-component system heavy metal sensor histidine kinase CusS
MKQRLYPHSMTTRLGVLFALVTVFTFAVVGTYLYHSLAIQLEARDDAELIEKVGIIRLLAARAESIEAIRNNPYIFADSAMGHDRLTLVVRAADGSVLFDSNSLDEVGNITQAIPARPTLPAVEAVPVDRKPQHLSIRMLKVNGQTQTRAVTAWCHVGSFGERIEITVARATSDRMALLEVYRVEVMAAVLCGALLAALLGYLVVRHGLRPVREIAGQAGSITASRLETRLNATEAPQELQEMVQVFNEMLDRLQRSFQRLSRFSADIAHDLRTPLNNLMIQTQVALSQPRTLEDYQALLASNVEEYERLSRMAESMLFLARAEHANLLPSKTVLDTPDELRRIAEYFEGLAEDAGVTLRVTAAGRVNADAILFRRAVGNLVANAIRYTPAGGNIVLSACCTSDATTISVSNPGVGIEKQHLPKIFDRFYRADAARQDSASSAGLGLAIVKSIMSLHGGRAEVDSIPHRMTRFHLIFPNGDIVLPCPD